MAGSIAPERPSRQYRITALIINCTPIGPCAVGLRIGPYGSPRGVAISCEREIPVPGPPSELAVHLPNSGTNSK